MTTDTTQTATGTDQSTATGDAGTGAAKTILGDAGTSDAGNTADASKEADAGKTADDAAGDKTAEKDGDAKSSDKKDDAPAGPPEKYEFTLPDGMELDTALVEKADPVFRELGLSNEQAQKLAQLVAEQRVSEGQAQQDAYAKQIETWAKDTYADKELGGSEAEVQKTVSKYVPAVLNAFGTPELKALVTDTGVGNHPEIVRLFVRVGKAMAEDGGVLSRSSATQKSASDVLFDHPTSQPKR